MAKILYLIRHGESIANTQGIYQGQSFDTDLTKQGQQQARLAAKILKKVKAKSIYVSPLKRTYQTAEEIRKMTGLKMATDSRILEINHGEWEGQKTEQFSPKEKKRLNKWQTEPMKVTMPHGENVKAVMLRCRQFVTHISDGKYLVITHDVVIRTMIILALNQKFQTLFWQYSLDNGGITTVGFEPNKVITINQNCHLNNHQARLDNQAL